ncbi:hypothetical protein BDR22DRAFT_962975 [Usnea florida]
MNSVPYEFVPLEDSYFDAALKDSYLHADELEYFVTLNPAMSDRFTPAIEEEYDLSGGQIEECKKTKENEQGSKEGKQADKKVEKAIEASGTVEQPSPYITQSIPKLSGTSTPTKRNGASKATMDTETDGDAADSADQSSSEQFQSARNSPNTGVSTKPNATQQRGGLPGAQANANKRKAEGLPEPLPKKAKEVIKKEVVWIDEGGEQISIAYTEASIAERDQLWEHISSHASELLSQMRSRFPSEDFLEDDLALIKVERHASLLPTLLSNAGTLRMRRQQENHMQVKETSVRTYLRQVERSVAEALSETEKMEAPTTQAGVQERLLQLPRSMKTITRMEHSQMLAGHLQHQGMVAENLRQELALQHLALEKHVRNAANTENQVREIVGFLRTLIKGGVEAGSLPALAMTILRPRAHQCKCDICMNAS